MADRVFMPFALDSNHEIVSGAEAYFFQRGTTTPIDVYSDEAATTLHTQPVVADSSGVFPAVYTTSALKMDVRTPGGVSLPGYPSDPAYIVSASGASATATTFSPITGNSATNVQSAIQNLTTLWNAVTTFGKSLINDADAAEARTTLGLGSAATQDVGTSENNVVQLDATGLPAVDGSQLTNIPDSSKIGAWVTFNGTGTPAVIAGDNVSSITDNGAGDYTINFTTDIADANYAVVGGALGDGAVPTGNRYTVNVLGDGAGNAVTKTVSAVRVIVVNPGSGSVVDCPEVYVGIIR